MVRVNSFLGCCKLETGGYIIGGIGIVVYGFVIIALIFGIAAFATVTGQHCSDMAHNFDSDYNSQMSSRQCSAFQGAGIVIMIIVLIFVILGFVTDVLLVVGVKKRERYYLLPALITTGLSILYCFQLLFSGTVQGFISGVIDAVIVAYCFIVIYSLYATFRDEYNQRYVAQYQQPISTNAQPYNPNAPPFNPTTQPMYPSGQPMYPGAQQVYPNAQPYNPSAQPLYPEKQPMYPNLPQGKV